MPPWAPCSPMRPWVAISARARLKFDNVAAIRVLLARFPVFHVDVGHQFSVQQHGNPRALAADRHPVPLAGFLHRRLAGRRVSEDAPASPGGRDIAPFRRLVVQELDLDRVGNPVLNIGAIDQHAAVGGRFEVELQVENEILVILLRPNNLVFVFGRQLAILPGPNAGREDCIRQVDVEQIGPGR